MSGPWHGHIYNSFDFSMHENQYVVRSNLHEIKNLIKDTQENKYAGNLMIWYKCVCVCVCVWRGEGEGNFATHQRTQYLTVKV